MKLTNSCKITLTLLILTIIFALPAYPAKADTIIHESATLGPTGQTSGWGLGWEQFIGSRFYVNQQVEVTAIGGHLTEWNSPGDLFGAIIALTGPDDLPDGSPFYSPEVVASTVFDPGFLSSDFRTPLSVTLQPGYYALVFGTDELGASDGQGAMPYEGQVDLPGASYFIWAYDLYWEWGWYNTLPTQARFVVEGTPGYCGASGGIDEYISGVKVGSIDNSSGRDGYADYTSLSTEMQIGQNYDITVTNGEPYEDGNDLCGIWVDWNQDKDFDDPNETITVTGNPGDGPYTATITPPADAVLGDTRMRIRIRYNVPLSPCDDTTYGEVEDYTITVTGGTLKVSGHVTLSNGTPLSGVLLEAYYGSFTPSGLTDISDENGYYEITLDSPWTGHIKADKDHYGFNWPTHFTDVTTDQTQNFSAYYTYSGGFGIPGQPYLIATPEDMNAIGAHQEDWDKYFRMIADIDLSEYTGTEYSIIGNVGNPFTGVFDGNSHTISNFTYSTTLETSPNVGLFGFVDKTNPDKGVIKDLFLINPDISTDSVSGKKGSLVGFLQIGKVSNCHVYDGNVTANYAGGLVGENYFGEVNKCSFNGTVTGVGIAGLVSMNRSGKVRESYSNAEINSYAFSGGLIAENRDSPALVSDCYSMGTVKVPSGDLILGGGLIAINKSGAEVSRCYSTNQVLGEGNYIGGFVGSVEGGSFSDCFCDIDKCMQSSVVGSGTSTGIYAKTTLEMLQEATFTNWDFTTPIWKICEGTNYPKLACQIPVAGDFVCPDGVEMKDFAVIGMAWLSNPNDAHWNWVCDISDPNDNAINALDLKTFAENWLKGVFH